MKLYATTTSERATKGQGGKYIVIEVFAEDKSKIANLHFYQTQKQSVYMQMSNYGIAKVFIDGQEIKGKQKKDDIRDILSSSAIDRLEEEGLL